MKEAALPRRSHRRKRPRSFPCMQPGAGGGAEYRTGVRSGSGRRCSVETCCSADVSLLFTSRTGEGSNWSLFPASIAALRPDSLAPAGIPMTVLFWKVARQLAVAIKLMLPTITLLSISTNH